MKLVKSTIGKDFEFKVDGNTTILISVEGVEVNDTVASVVSKRFGKITSVEDAGEDKSSDEDEDEEVKRTAKAEKEAEKEAKRAAREKEKADKQAEKEAKLAETKE